MNRKNKLKSIYYALDPVSKVTEADFGNFDSEVAKLKSNLTQNISEKMRIANMEAVGSELKRLKSSFDLQPIIEALNGLEENFKTSFDEINHFVKQKTDSLGLAIQQQGVSSSNDIKNIYPVIQSVKAELESELGISSGSNKGVIAGLQKQISDALGIKDVLNKSVGDINNTITGISKKFDSQYTKKEAEKSYKETQDSIEQLRKDLLQRIAGMGGGSMSRQMFIGGVDPLTHYTDINLKAGAGTTITYANNNNTKKVDITITATGSGSGITRNVNSVSTPTNAGSTASIDYVYLVTGTTTITLPDATTNTNLYTIKNVGSGVVTIATTSGQTVDGASSLTLPVQTPMNGKGEPDLYHN